MADARDKLMHSEGTSAYETVVLIVPTLFYASITTVLVFILNISNQTFQFCLEFVTLVIPIILNVTVLSEYATLVLTTSCVACLSLLLYANLYCKPGKCKTVSNAHLQDYITNSRSTINMISVVAILAVDFLVFPRRLAKTQNFGHSLMDVGVGLFMFSNGIVDGGQTDLLKSLKDSIPLLVLGTIRLLVTKQIDYNVPVSEYGVHWNFFITLAVTKIFVSLIFSVIHVKYIWINAGLLLVSHEVLLQCGLSNFVMSDVKRSDFVSANREGLVSSVGYVCVYLLSAHFSYLVGLKKRDGHRKSAILQFTGLSLVMLGLSLLCDNYFGTSRKLANAAYCFWILFIGIFMTGLYYGFGHLLDNIFRQKLQMGVRPPFIFQAINYNGLAFFLVSNLLTGGINIVLDTLTVGPVHSLVIISIYMLINCALVCILYTKRIKLKF